MVDLGGKVAIVTGAGSGIGRACAVAFGAAGAAVVANDLEADGLGSTLAAVEAAGGTAVSSVGDVRSPAVTHGLVELASSTFGGLDVMVANAAVSVYTNLEEQDEETIDVVLDTDLKGALLCAQASIPAIRGRGGGSIVFLSSVQGYVTLPGCVPYAAAKAGVVAAARALAVEVGVDGIRVNAVAPGMTRTPLYEAWVAEQNDPEATRREVAASVPQGRIAEPGDIAAAIV